MLVAVVSPTSRIRVWSPAFRRFGPGNDAKLRTLAAEPPKAVTMQLNGPLPPALSPSEGERENPRSGFSYSPFGEQRSHERSYSLSPSEGERAGERGPFNWIVPAKGGTPNPNPRSQVGPFFLPS
jgi:hypothetical protein